MSDGEWIGLKHRLNAGETRAAFTRMCKQGIEPLTIDPMQVGLATMNAYLVEWSLTDDDGHIVEIPRDDPDALDALLGLLEPERFDEIRIAVLKHEADQDAIRAQKKTPPAGAMASPEISPSLVGVGGGTSG